MRIQDNIYGDESMTQAINRAEILMEALPYIRKFHGKTIVIKFGGAAMKDEDLRTQFARDVVLLQYVGMRPIIVHGGGPQINRLLEGLGIESYFVDGHRVTDEKAMEVVEMVLSGFVNKDIVGLINHEGGKAVGISGKDGGLAKGTPHHITRKKEDGTTEEVSLGRVGNVLRTGINPAILLDLYKDGYIPVIAPVAVDSDGKSLNVNADTMAGAIAGALRAEKLILLTDTPGVMKDSQTVTGLIPTDVYRLINEGTIKGGMIPKTECCLKALEAGVKRTHIIDGRVAHALLLEIFTDKGVGTLISHSGDSDATPHHYPWSGAAE
jgi:acetylglutamate kinase